MISRRFQPTLNSYWWKPLPIWDSIKSNSVRLRLADRTNIEIGSVILSSINKVNWDNDFISGFPVPSPGPFQEVATGTGIKYPSPWFARLNDNVKHGRRLFQVQKLIMIHKSVILTFKFGQLFRLSSASFFFEFLRGRLFSYILRKISLWVFSSNLNTSNYDC